MKNDETLSRQFELLLADYKAAHESKNISKDEVEAWAFRFVEFGEANLTDQAGLDALIWVTRMNRRSWGFKNANDRAASLLFDHHRDRKETAAAVFEMRTSRSPKALDNLRRFMTSKNDNLRGLAAFALGWRLKNSKNEEEVAEAVDCLERVITNHPTLVATKSGQELSVPDLAKRTRFEIQNLQVGMEAPETKGVLLCGGELQLSDHVGQVVMLSFWGDG